MNAPSIHFGRQPCIGWFFLFVAAACTAQAQPSGLFQSVPGSVAIYRHQPNVNQQELLPVDLMVNFTDANPTSMLSATILKPIIGAATDGTPIFPIATYFPMRVTGSSQDGHEFHGSLLDTQYLFMWQFDEVAGGELKLNGHVFWAGGRYEDTTIADVRLIPAVAGDYNRNGTVDTADYAVWRKNVGTSDSLPNDLVGGTIGPAQYDQWRAHYGQTAGAGASLGSSLSSSTVPEPCTILLLVTVLTAFVIHSRGVRGSR
jgi:hypothetical protein